MAEECTIEVRGLWDQKPDVVTVPSSIAEICHEFSKVQTVALQYLRYGNSISEESANFEPFIPILISMRAGTDPIANAEDGSGWTSERMRKLFSCTGETLRPPEEEEESLNFQSLGFYLLLGYVLRDKEGQELSIFAGPVYDPEDPFILLGLNEEDIKRLTGFHVGGNPCTGPPWIFTSAQSLIRLTPTSFKSITCLFQPSIGQVVVGADDW